MFYGIVDSTPVGHGLVSMLSFPIVLRDIHGQPFTLHPQGSGDAPARKKSIQFKIEVDLLDEFQPRPFFGAAIEGAEGVVISAELAVAMVGAGHMVGPCKVFALGGTPDCPRLLRVTALEARLR